MRKWRQVLILGAMTVFLAAFSGAAFGSDSEGKERNARRKLHWWEHYQPSENAPEMQLALANELKDNNHDIRASRAYVALINAWPDSPQAPVAQLNYCRLLEKRNKPKKAFEQYQFLVDAYSGFFPYDEVMGRMYAIADYMASRKRYFLFFKFNTPEEAIPMFEQLIMNGAQWRKASELQFRIAQIYEETGQYDLAIQAYGLYHQRYSSGPMAEQALFAQAYCCYKYSREHPVSDILRENAAAALQGFLAWYPAGDMADSAKEYLSEIRNEISCALFRRAEFYDKTAGLTRDEEERGKNLVAAGKYYRKLVDEFPRSEQAAPARDRLLEITKETGHKL